MTLEGWRFCPRCAGALRLEGDAAEAHVSCDRCAFQRYQNPVPTTLAMIVGGGKLLLTQRSQSPREGFWDTVGGFVNIGETAEQCVRREVQEELGCSLRSVVPLGTFASVYGDTGRQTLGIAFVCELDPGAEIRLSDESAAWAWFALDDLPELAFRDGQDAATALAAIDVGG